MCQKYNFDIKKGGALSESTPKKLGRGKESTNRVEVTYWMHFGRLGDKRKMGESWEISVETYWCISLGSWAVNIALNRCSLTMIALKKSLLEIMGKWFASEHFLSSFWFFDWAGNQIIWETKVGRTESTSYGFCNPACKRGYRPLINKIIITLNCISEQQKPSRGLFFLV